jgi:hypothetical protein
MDDRRAHFVTMLGDVCLAAHLGRIPVELLLGDGVRVSGTPVPQVADGGSPPVSDTGYASWLLIGGCATHLEDVVELVIRAPAD